MAKRQSMKKNLFVAALLGALAVPSFGAATLSFSPVTATSGGVSFVTVAVNISGITGLAAYNYDVTFNSSVIKLTSTAEGSFLSGFGPTFYDEGTLDNTAGLLDTTFNVLTDPGVTASGSGTLQTLTFVLGPASGVATLGFSNLMFSDANSQSIAVTANGLTLPINAVPEPESYVLMAAGLAGLAAWRRRQA